MFFINSYFVHKTGAMPVMLSVSVAMRRDKPLARFDGAGIPTGNFSSAIFEIVPTLRGDWIDWRAVRKRQVIHLHSERYLVRAPESA